MKTLEELGISPAPWQWDGDERTDDMVLSAGGRRVAEWMDANDARLIAAAPDLYEALREVYERIADIQDEHSLSHADGEDVCDECRNTYAWLSKARAALEKAGGAE